MGALLSTRVHEATAPSRSFSFTLKATPPFRLDLTAWTLRRRRRNLIDRWDGVIYRRVLPLGDQPVLVAVSQLGSAGNPRLKIVANGTTPDAGMKANIAELIKRMLGIRLDLREFYAMAAGDAKLRALAERFRGMKPPRFPTVFEALVNAIACQQLSLIVGIELLNRLSGACGLPVREGEELLHAFPRPADIVRLGAQDVQKLGFNRQKSRSLLELAETVLSGKLDLEGLAALTDEQAIETLTKIRGIGRWSAEYALLRGLGRWNVFPGDDVGARNKLEKWLGRRKPLDYAGVRRALNRWQKYAGLVYFHLLLSGLAQAGDIAGQPGSDVNDYAGG